MSRSDEIKQEFPKLIQKDTQQEISGTSSKLDYRDEINSSITVQGCPGITNLNVNSTPSLTVKEHLITIAKRQKVVPNLVLDSAGLSSHWGHPFSLGCVACKNNKWVAVFVGKACNAKCSFCPQSPKPSLGDEADNNGTISTSFSSEDYMGLLPKLCRAATRGDVTAIGYSGGEPLLYLERILHYAYTLYAENPGLYQYVYTNGLLVSKERLLRLKEAGIKEVRFNLAAMDFSEKVIANMSLSKEVIPFLTIEVPALKGIAQKLIHHIEQFVNIGVDQINLCEVLINKNNFSHFRLEPFYVADPREKNSPQYNNSYTPSVPPYKRMSPIWSRHEVYDLLEFVVRSQYKLTINDCSQFVHFKGDIPYCKL